MLDITFNFAAVAGLVIAMSSLLMAAVMLLLTDSQLNRIWAAFCTAVFIWGFSFFFVASAKTAEIAELWWRISHIGVILIPVLFIHFVYIFLKSEDRPWLREIYLAGFVFIVLDIFSNLLINGTRYVFDSFYYDTPGPLYLPFVIFFHGVIVYGHWLLFKAYYSSKDEKRKEQIRYFFMATFVGFLGGGISFAPVFGLDMYPYTIITVALYPVIMGYAISRFNLFNLRVVAAQVTSVSFFVFMVVRFALSEGQTELVINGIFLLIACGVGIFLVRSVTKEVEARQKLEKITADLEKANLRLRELDRQKSEFLGIAAHQLRTPITAIKGYSSLILEGSYGKTTKALQKTVQTIFHSSNRMAETIDDFLNISRIEQGKMEYHKAPMDITPLIKASVDMFSLPASLKGIEMTVSDNECSHGKHMINADEGKIQHVINNLLDNSIKYTPKGKIVVSLICGEKTIKVSVKDSGAGIPKETLPELFDKFVRARNAKQINVTGSGLGLYVAKQMIQAHDGKIWAESEGEGKGSTFSFELPAI